MREYIVRIEHGADGAVHYFRTDDEIVRCKDCRYYDYPFSNPKESADAYPERWCCLLGMGGAFSKNGYCPHGERRNDE